MRELVSKIEGVHVCMGQAKVQISREFDWFLGGECCGFLRGI